MYSRIERLFHSTHPRRRAPSRRRTRPELQQLEGRQLLSNASTNLGPIIPNVQVEAVFYGAQWGNGQDPDHYELLAQESDLGNFLATLTSSQYLTGLNQYWGVAGRNFWGPNIARPGLGSYVGSDYVPAALGNQVNEGAVQSMLNGEIANGHVPAPNGNTL
jgi:hypothetical protein